MNLKSLHTFYDVTLCSPACKAVASRHDVAFREGGKRRLVYPVVKTNAFQGTAPISGLRVYAWSDMSGIIPKIVPKVQLSGIQWSQVQALSKRIYLEQSLTSCLLYDIHCLSNRR